MPRKPDDPEKGGRPGSKTKRPGTEKTAGGSRPDEHGREAERPRDIPRRGFRDIMWRVLDEQSKDNLNIVAGGVAFYALLSIFPALVAVVSIYGLVSNPGNVQNQISSLSGVMPQTAYQLIQSQLQSIVQHSGSDLSWGVVIGILAALWSANKGMQALIASLNIVYDQQETRSYIRLNAWSLLLTAGAVAFCLVSLGFIVGVPAILGKLPLPGPLQTAVRAGRWPLLGLFVVIGLTLVYRYAPDRSQPRWQWVSWGAVIATVGWILASVGFSYYVTFFGSYNKTYGSLGAVVVLMMWFYLTAYLALMGAEINAEMEHQTRRDTTRGPSKPMGQREAHVADTLGAKADEDD